MGLIVSPLPDPGEPVGPAEAKVDAFLRETRQALNGGLTAENLSASLAGDISPPVLSSPPGDPVDGDAFEFHPVAGVAWTFRYHAAIGDPYKWLLESGTPIKSSDFTGNPAFGTASVATFFPLGGGLVTLPLAGEYWVDGQIVVDAKLGTFRARVAVNTVLADLYTELENGKGMAPFSGAITGAQGAPVKVYAATNNVSCGVAYLPGSHFTILPRRIAG